MRAFSQWSLQEKSSHELKVGCFSLSFSHPPRTCIVSQIALVVDIENSVERCPHSQNIIQFPSCDEPSKMGAAYPWLNFTLTRSTCSSKQYFVPFHHIESLLRGFPISNFLFQRELNLKTTLLRYSPYPLLDSGQSILGINSHRLP